MHVWKMAKTLSNPKDPEWDLLVRSSLGEDVHPDRINGFLLSREALKEALSVSQIYPSPLELFLTHSSRIQKFPQFTISLSHTPECGAAYIADRKYFRSLGIDIEREDRVVKESIAQRISHPDDAGLRNIEVWCLKEAVFKTLMNTELFLKPIEFSSICIHQNEWSHSPSKLRGKWELDIIKPFVLARAFLEN